MPHILLFGGTSEGRQLAEWISQRGTCTAVACSATEYGGQLVSGLPGIQVLVGPLNDEAKERLLTQHQFCCIVDATHPYATHVTESLTALGHKHNLPVLRLVREDDTVDDVPFQLVEDAQAAARVVARTEGNILLTTGTKDLPVFTQALPHFADRLFARVLPVPQSVAQARDLGFPASHIVAMQGPFSVEFNQALMKQLDIRVMVTKASGAAGGFSEKLQAAHNCGVQVVVIGRPVNEQGLTLAQVKDELEAQYGA